MEMGRPDDAVPDLRRVIDLLPPDHELTQLAEQFLMDLAADDD